MTTRIGSGGPATGVSASASAARVTAPPGQPFRAVMHAGAGAIMSGAEQAMTRLPGGPILAAALRPTPGQVGPATTTAPTGATFSPEGAAGTAGDAGAPTPSSEAQGLQSALDEGANQNLFWLGVQERINSESRDYSAQSNILKARHDTVKNAIGNIR